MLISIIIPVYNQVALLGRCLASLARSSWAGELQVLVVDDASPEDPGPVCAEHGFVTLLRHMVNRGYAAANNTGLALADGDWILFLNSDTELGPEVLDRMVAVLSAEPGLGGVAPLHRGPTGDVQRTCFAFPTLKTGRLWDSTFHRRNPDHRVFREFLMAEWDHRSTRSVEHAQTSCLMIRREAYEVVGGMDERLTLFYNDTDYCRRLHQADFPLRFVAEIEILHHGNASVQTFEKAEAQVYGDRYRYFRKWYGWRGGLTIRWVIWSRITYEALSEVAHGQFRFAWRKVRRGLRINRALVARS